MSRRPVAAAASAANDTRPDGEDMESQVAPQEVVAIDKSPEEEQESGYQKNVGYKGIFKEFVWMGWTAFGGPAAHIGMFERRFVTKLKWLSPTVFLELLALGQCMPGPTSTQMSFGIGIAKKGVLGGLLSGALFQYPGLLIMSIVGVGAAEWLVNPDRWLRCVIAGLAATAVALVASAAKGLCTKICTDRVTAVLCTLSAAIAYYYQSAWLFPTLIVIGGLTTYIQNRKKDVTLKEFDDSVESHGFSMFWGGIVVAAWLLILIICIVLVNVINTKRPTPLDFFEKFWRVGSMIYGGGQVVLPLLEHEVVYYNCKGGTDKCATRADTWVTYEQYYAGLAVVQGMPGPLFNFAAYLGAIIAKKWDYNPIIGIILCWVGLFGPGICLIFGVFPFWHRFRKWAPYRKALPGLNAAAVGLVVTAVFQMTFQVYSKSPFPFASVCIGIFAFGAVDVLNLFEPGVILGGGLLGAIAWAAGCK